MRYRLKTLLAATAICAICLAAVVAIRQSVVGRVRYARRLEAQIESLRARQPGNLNAAQWNCLVDWTRNLHGNSLIAFQTSTGQIAAFESRVRRRLAGTVDASTVEWLWDEYAEVCPGGLAYQRFRALANEELTALKSPVLLEPPRE